MKAVVLCGGEGTRLKPYTTVFPKPLMPIGDRPILEIILCQLKAHGVDRVFMAVGHLAELVMAFFGDGSRFGMQIDYSREDKPLGTAGPLDLLRGELAETFMMMNGDVLSSISYSELVQFHKAGGHIGTVALKKREIPIDFGVARLEDNCIVEYVEKPTVYHLVSMGVYVFEPRVLDYIKPGERLDFPNLIHRLIEAGERVGGYVFDGYWLDIGRPEDYERANAEIGELLPRLGLKGGGVGHGPCQPMGIPVK